MTGIISAMLLTAVFGGAIWGLYLKDEVKSKSLGRRNDVYFIWVMVIGLAVHIIAAACYYGHKTDMGCFIGWSDKLFKNGLSQFYISEGFHDYPPGYVYVMYVLGAIKNLFGLDGIALQILIKLPAMLTDMVIGCLVYNFASKRFSSAVSAVFSAIIVFNPTTILNSAVWGQVDSILALFCILTVYFSAEKKFIPAIAAFAAGVLIKPQAIFVFPVLAFALVDDIWLSPKYNPNKLIRHFITGICGVLTLFILFMPFGTNPIHGIKIIIEQYIETTMNQYNYMSVNAFNIFSAAGNNWAKLTTGASILGYVSMVLVVLYSGYVFFKSKSPAKHYICAFILFFGMYMFGVKQHERYAFTGIIMLLYTLVLVPNTKNFAMYGLFSLSQFFNTAWALFGYENTMTYVRSSTVITASVINLIMCIVFVHIIQKDCVNFDAHIPTKDVKQSGRKPTKKSVQTSIEFAVSEKKQKLTKFDILFVVGVMAVYSAIALYNLGNMFAPQSETAVTNSGIVIDFGEEKEIKKTEFYLGARHLYDGRNLEMEFRDGSNNVVKTHTATSGDVFDWTITDLTVNARYVKLSTNYIIPEDDPTSGVYLREICFLDADGNQLVPVNKNDDGIANIFDEQHMMAKGKEFMSGTIFDEIYHPRTAYEFVHDMSVYEWTHPPLGKVIIGLGILIFGMVPFGWRIAGTVFGILMIPIIYMFARRVLKNKGIAAIVCLIFTFDFMHFTQTRIATIDTYVTFFIILMYYYMYKYYKMSFYDTPLKKTLIPLGLSGLFFGLGVACKWPALYAGAGLALIFFYTLFRRWREYNAARRNPKGNTNGIDHAHVNRVFANNTAITLIFCVVMFVIVPVVIYTLSYAPFWDTPSGKGIGTAFKEIDRMWTYHSKTVADSTHPFSSHWYEWPVMYRPLYYFSNTLENGMVQGISSFGNPAVWWVGIPAFAFVLAFAVIIPLRNKNYFGKSKWFYGAVYTEIFAILTILALAGTNTNDKLERLYSCVLLYSIIMVAVFWLVLMYDKSFKQKSNTAAVFLVIAYLAQLVPWIPVTRTTYIYHYFPSIPFVVLMIGYSIKIFYDNARNKSAVAAGALIYAIIAVALFAMFYPVLSGAPISVDYGKNMLRWFESWVLFPG